MSHKTALITGGNTGIGLAVAEKLVANGVRVCLGCRSKTKAKAARATLLEKHPSAEVEIIIIDVANLASVTAAVNDIKLRYDHIDYLYLNAGIMPVSTVDWKYFWSQVFSSKCLHMFRTGDGLLRQVDGETDDGLKQIFATNLFGHFVMVRELEDRLGGPDRVTQIIWTSSSNAKRDAFSLRDIQHREGFEPYSSSKYAVDLLSVALNNKYNKQGIYSHSTCPGLVMTNLTFGILPSWVWLLLLPLIWLLRLFTSNLTLSTENGAEALYWLSSQNPTKMDPLAKYNSRQSFLGRSYAEPTKMDIDEADAMTLYSSLSELDRNTRPATNR